MNYNEEFDLLDDEFGSVDGNNDAAPATDAKRTAGSRSRTSTRLAGSRFSARARSAPPRGNPNGVAELAKPREFVPDYPDAEIEARKRKRARAQK